MGSPNETFFASVVMLGLLMYEFLQWSLILLREVSSDLRLMMLMGLMWVVVAVVIIVLDRKYFLSPNKKNIMG